MAVQTMRVPTIFTAVDRFSDVVSKMTMKTAAFGKSAEAAAMRTSRKFNDMGNSMLTTGVAIATGIGYAVNEAAKFEDRIANIGTLLPELNTLQLKGVGDKLLEFSKNTSKPIDEITASFYDLISAGVKLNDAYPLLKSIDDLSIAGLGSLTEATDIQLAAMRNFKTSFKDSDDAANVLFKTVKYGVTTVQKLSEAYSANAGFAGDLGVTGQEFSAGIVGLTATKMPTAQAQVGLGSISNQIGKTTAKRNKILFSIFQKLGVSNGNDLVKKSGGFLPTLTAISEQAKKAGINMQSVFPEKRASNTFLKLTSNVDAIDAYNKSLQDFNDKSNVAINVAKKLKEETASFKIGQLKNDMLGLAITIGEALLPRVKNLVDSIGNISKNIIVWSEKNNFLVNTLFFVAKWLLILGIYLKLSAFLFYGISKAIAFATFATEAYTVVTELCTVATMLAAAGQQTLAGSLMAVAGGLLAAYWPVLVVVGALGLLTYAFWDIGDAAESSSTKQIDALMAQNKAYTSSTNVLSTELQKQEALLNNHNAKVATPKMYLPAAPKSEAQSKYDKIILAERERSAMEAYNKNIERIDAEKSRARNELNNLHDSKYNTGYYTMNQSNFMQKQLDKDKNLLFLKSKGMSFDEIEKVYPNLTTVAERKQQLEIFIKDPGQVVAETKFEGTTYGPGVPVIVSSTKTPKK